MARHACMYIWPVPLPQRSCGRPANRPGWQLAGLVQAALRARRTCVGRVALRQNETLEAHCQQGLCP
jgi:hypothetical protein